MKKLLMILLAVCLIAGLAACNDTTEVYSLTFDTQGGGENTVIVLDGSAELAFPPEPQKEGYLFAGWFFDKDVWQQPVSLSLILQTGIAENKTVYARWNPKDTPIDPTEKPDVTFDTNGGAAVPAYTDIEVIETAPVPTRAGYQFLGWFENEGDQLSVVFPYWPEDDITLIAKWRMINYSIVYNLGGGVTSNPSTYNVETGEIVLGDPTRTGYTFEGWYTEETYENRVTSVRAGTTGNLRFYAKWRINSYQLVYHLNGSPYTVDGVPVLLTFDYGAPLTGTVGELSPEGYSFSGWKLNDGSALPETMPAQNLNVYGNLSPLVYTITYFVDGVSYESRQVAYGSTISYLPAPARPGSRFSGWQNTEGGAAPVTMPNGNIEVHGFFTNIFDIIFVLDGREYARISYDYQAEVREQDMPDDPARTGYIFSGWTGLPASMPDTDVNVTGSLIPKVYRLYFSAPQEGARVEGIPQAGGETRDYIEVTYDENFLYRLGDVKGVLFAYDFAGWRHEGAPFAPERWTFDYDEQEDGRFTVFAAFTEKSTQGLKYTLLPDNTYSVTGYSGVAAEVYVPSSYNGLPVKAISDTAFKNNQTVTMITLHRGISRLGTNSFENCSNLVTVNLPDTVQNIEAETFLNCASLASFTIPRGVGVIGNAPFRGCAALTEILVDEQNTQYAAGENGELYNKSRTSLIQFPQGKNALSFTVPSTVTTLGNYAFSNCVSLTSIELGTSVRSIGCNAFEGTSITSMTLSNNVTWIGSNAFDRCALLTSLSLPFVGSSKSKANTSEGLFGYIFGNAYFAGSVAAYQWYDAVSYVKYYLPASLTDVTLTDTYEVPYGAFSGCTGLNAVTLQTTDFVGEKAFFGCSALTEVNFSRALTGIGADAFNGCVALNTLVFPASLTYIGEYAFHNCPAGATGAYEAPAANYMEQYGYVYYDYQDPDRANPAYILNYTGPIGVNMVVDEMFEETEVVSVGKAFQNRSGMYSITLPRGFTKLDRHAFDGSGYLAIYAKTLLKPEVWTDRWDDPAIYWDAEGKIFFESDFNYYVSNNRAVITRYTGNAENLIIPQRMLDNTPVTGIGKYAFAGNTYLKSVTIYDNITSIGRGAFAGCTELTFISVDGLNTKYSSDAYGVLYDKTSTLLLQYPAGSDLTEYTVPATVKTIAQEAFSYSRLQRISFTNTLTTIEPAAFMNCAALTHVIDLNITGIGHIAEKMFYGCVSLASLTLPTAIGSIDNGAFEGCASLASVNGTAGARLVNFNSLTYIGNAAFMGCAALTALTLPTSLMEVGYDAFYGCALLTTVRVPDSVLAIGNAAFAGCSGLRNITLSANLARVSSNLLYGCTSLVSLTLPFVGSAAYASGTEDAVLGYLFGFSRTEPSAGTYTLQYYAEGAGAYYYIPAGLEEVILTRAKNLPYGAFSNIGTLINIEIGNTLVSIEESAFAGCGALESLVLPFVGASRTSEGAEAVLGYLFGESATGVTQVYGEGQEGVFAIPDGLASIEITDAAAIHRGAFYNVASLTDVVLNANIISIGEDILYGCIAVRTLVIPFVGSSRTADGTPDAVFGYLFGQVPAGGTGVEQTYAQAQSASYHISAGIERVEVTSAEIIPYGAFGAVLIPQIVINDGVETIGEYAFAYNTALTSFALPNSVITIERNAFRESTGLASVLLGRTQTVGDYAFYMTALTSLTLPDSVREIGEYAFANITALQSVSVSLYNSSLTTLKAYAFSGDSALEVVTLPNNLISIGEGILAGCSSLWKVSIPFAGASSSASGTREAMFGYIFGTSASAGASAVTQTYGTLTETFSIPDSLTAVVVTNATQIGGGAFSGLSGLTVALNEGITALRGYAFYGADIASLALPASVTTIEEEAFMSSDIVSVTFPLASRLRVIEDRAFAESTGLSAIVLPASLESIGDEAFMNAAALASVSFASGSVLREIGDRAFEGVELLTYIVLPASLLTIGNYAFYECSALAGVTFGTGAKLVSVGDGAFQYTSLQTVALPATTVSIGKESFADNLLTSITFGGEASLLTSIGDYAFAGTLLASIEIPSGVRMIGLNPFLSTPVASIALSGYRTGYKVINNVLYSIDGSVLIAYPKSLTAASFAVPESVTRVESLAFAGNLHLVNVTLPSGLLSIGRSAFELCMNLASVAFGANPGLLVIEDSAFHACLALTSFPMPSSLIRIGDGAFTSTGLTALDLSNASGLISIGEEAFLFCDALESVILPASLKELGAGAFSYCGSLTSVNLGNLSALTAIPDRAFYGSALTSAVIHANVETIGNGAFAYTLLTSVLFADGALREIGDEAFMSGTLQSLTLPDTLTKLGRDAFRIGSLRSLTIPFIGASVDAEGESATAEYVFGDTYSVIETLVIRNRNEAFVLSASAFSCFASLKHVTLGACVISVEEGIFDGLQIESLELEFAGASATATGREGLLGYLFGFDTASGAGNVAQSYSDTETAYARIPSTLRTVVIGRAPGYGALSGIVSLTSVTVIDGDTLGKNLVAGCTSLTSLTLPYAGASATAAGEQGRLSYLTGGTLPWLTTLQLTKAELLTADTLDTAGTVRTLSIAGDISEMPEGLLAGCNAIIDLTIPFAGRAANAQGGEGLMGYLFGFKASPTANTIAQVVYASSGTPEYYYSEIPYSLSRVTLENAVAIAQGAFSNMTWLLTVTAYGNVAVGDRAFFGCLSLQAFVLGDGAHLRSVGDYAFAGARFESITISADVTYIGAHAFDGCESLTTVTFEPGSRLTAVGEYAFSGCTVLRNIELPEGVLTIGNNAFGNCVTLMSAVVPSSVVTMGADVFAGCINLATLSVPFVGPNKTGATSSSTDRISYLFGTVPLSLTSLTVTSATYLADYALQGTQLTALNLNEGILQIGSHALSGVPVTSLVLPASVLSIGDYAFFNSGIRTFSAASGSRLATVGNHAFEGCSLLSDIVLPDSVTYIGAGAFTGALLNVRFSVPFIGSSRTATGASAVLGYFFGTAASGVTQKYASNQSAVYAIPSTLKNVYVTSATSIGYGAFSGCGELTQISINAGAETLGQLSLEGTVKLETLTLPYAGNTAAASGAMATMRYLYGETAASGIANVKTIHITAAQLIAASAFAGMTGLVNVTLNDGINSIAQGAFAGCTAIKTMTVPYIGSRMMPSESTPEQFLLGYWFERKTAPAAGVTGQVYLNGTEQYYYAVIPQGLETITVTSAYKLGYGALSSLTALKTVQINSTLTEFGQNVLKGSNAIETVTVPFIGRTKNATQESELLLTYLFGNTPSTLTVINVTAATQIGRYAFANNTKITTVVLNEGITAIGNSAFAGMTSLTSVNMPSTLRTIGASAFAGCTSLSSIVFPGTLLTTISERAFENTAVNSLVIPDSVTTLGEGLLTGCMNLESLTTPFVGMSRTATGQNALLGYLFGILSSAGPRTTTQIYTETNNAIYTVLPDNLYELHVTSATALGFGALYNCSTITSLTLNEGLLTVGRLALANCSGLESLVVPDSVTNIASAAFSGCSSLKSISLPFVGTSRNETGATALFGYVFGTVDVSVSGATVQYFDATSSRTYYVPDLLESVAITSATSLGYGAFYNMSRVKSISVNEGVASVPQKAFYNCAAVTSLTIPSTVTSIAAGALEGMSSLVTISLPFAGTSPSAVGAAAQFGAIFGTTTGYDANVYLQTTASGAGSYYKIPFSLRFVTLTQSTQVKAYTFAGCAGIAVVTFAKPQTAIGDYAFAGCAGLAAFYGDLSALTSIGDGAFENCRSFLGVDLTQAQLLEHIGNRAFAGCPNLAFLIFPDNLTNLPPDILEGSNLAA